MGSFMSSTSASTAAAPSDINSIRNFIESENAAHQVVIWSKIYCQYCAATKKLFQKTLQLTPDVVTVHELDQMSNGSAIQDELDRLTGQSTVPSVFVNGKHLGGNDDTQKAHRDGRLSKMLQQT